MPRHLSPSSSLSLSLSSSLGKLGRRLERRSSGEKGDEESGAATAAGCGRSMEATSRVSNTNNHPAATANLLVGGDDAAVHGETAVARPCRRQLLLRLPPPGRRQPQRTHQAVAAFPSQCFSSRQTLRWQAQRQQQVISSHRRPWGPSPLRRCWKNRRTGQ
uniref:Uncharacterized protein n=1 Tax=Oryza meridionalis TaxID=40149 RepID=A0A0E0E2H6_9ORYZ